MQGIEEAFVQYYERRLGIYDTTGYSNVSDNIVNDIPVLTSNYQLRLCAPFNVDDVKQQLFDIDDTQVVGPNSSSLRLFALWKILKQNNAKFFCLMPKSEQPQYVTQFRPRVC